MRLARAAFSAFVDRWKLGDVDCPMLIEARHAVVRLQQPLPQWNAPVLADKTFARVKGELPS